MISLASTLLSSSRAFMADSPLRSRLLPRPQLRLMWHRVPGGALSWLCDPEHLVFAMLILLHVIPIWGFAYFPSQDGPAP